MNNVSICNDKECISCIDTLLANTWAQFLVGLTKNPVIQQRSGPV